MKRRNLLALTAGAFAAPSIVRAQAKYPDRPVRLVIPFPPAGPTDIIGRMTAERLTAVLGQNVVVENKAGAAGSIGAVEVKNARPDGYTFLFATSSTHAINPTAFTKPPYDPIKDFTPVSSICVNPLILVAHPSMPDTLMGLVDLMKKNPGKYSYGSSGTGGITHLAGEYLKSAVGGMDVVHVPYRGSMPALQDMMAGNVAWMFETISTSLQLHRSGRVRILGFAHNVRTPAAPDIPTIIEAGVPGYEAYTFNLILGPAGVAPGMVEVLDTATRKLMADKAFIEALEKIAAVPTTDTTPERTGKFIKDELAKWAPIIKAADVKIE
ncbi:MAG: tripartite tricarboxylate transporter substrate binding protein [Reyranella sp.]|nr:tripartite tricarboxylate transporter substrate binding protein [Reyranella sp.]